MNPPKPFCINPSKIKAFVLGCDPTGFDKNGNRLEFQFVFDINGKDNRYFAGILANLKLLGIGLEDIYVQNLVTKYQHQETAKNKDWDKIAEIDIPLRKKELDAIDLTNLVPVFITSQHLYKVLLNPTERIYTANELYTSENLAPIKPEQNKLQRTLIPLFRHYAYNLSEKEEYKNRIRDIWSHD